MKTMIIRGPGNYGVEDTSVPEPQKGELLLRVEACGLCGSDLRTLRSGHQNIRFPWTLGHEVCGTVEEEGPEYRSTWKKGQRLTVGPLAYDPEDPYCIEGRPELSDGVREIGQAWRGGFAEYMILPREVLRMGNILPAPESLPSEYAAPAEPGSSVIHAQERAGISLGDNVLVIGTGPIGCLHASVARARGAKRIVLADLVQERLDMGGEFPVDGLINTAKEDIHRASEKYFGPRGPDVIITAAPAAEIQVLAAELIGKGGRIIFFGGLPHGNSKPGIDTNLIHYKNASIIGTSIFAPRHFRMSLEMIETGQIPVEKLVTHILPLRNFNRGVELAAAGKALKVVYKNNGR